jgi:hypothetical protein
LNGVTTLDLVLIQKYLLGLITLEGDDLIAADANANASVSAADLLALRGLILGIDSELANNDSWVFVPGSTDVSVDGADEVVNFGGIKLVTLTVLLTHSSQEVLTQLTSLLTKLT